MAGSPFRYEADMAPVAASWLHSERLFFKKEFTTPWGICDLVGVALNKTRVRTRLKLGQKRAIGPPRRVGLYYRLPDDRMIRQRTLEREYAGVLSPEQLSLELNRLIADGFVRRPKRGLYEKVNGWVPLHRRIVAVELKLSRVGDALHQAAAHLGFAVESYVGVPMDLAERIANGARAADFAGAGVGLLGITRQTCKPLLNAEPSHPVDTVTQMHCVERFWRTRVTGNSS